MKIVALIGSLRNGSFNRMVFNTYQEITKEKMSFIEGDYSAFPFINEDILNKKIPKEVEDLAAQIRSADGVIFFSPEYNYSVPGPLKNAIDWLSKVPDQPFVGKPTAIISASPGKIGGARMQYHLRQIGVFSDMKFLNKPEVMIGEVNKKFDAEGKLIDESTVEFLKKHSETFIKFIKG